VLNRPNKIIFRGKNMRKKHGIAMKVLAGLAALVLVLIIGVISFPWIIYIGFKHFKHKIKI
jgi:hypothetical protein